MAWRRCQAGAGRTGLGGCRPVGGPRLHRVGVAPGLGRPAPPAGTDFPSPPWRSTDVPRARRCCPRSAVPHCPYPERLPRQAGPGQPAAGTVRPGEVGPDRGQHHAGPLRLRHLEGSQGQAGPGPVRRQP
ncbi:hypothetical protein G6F40_015296 [Rhizopus arrhizus]|nr:hypothetical protein G6F40_015296 [Rhizopus arrhizus]